MNPKITQLLHAVYPPQEAADLEKMLADLLATTQAKAMPTKSRFSHEDAILITYADIVHSEQETPLAALNRLLTKHLKGAISTVHLLPFYPYSSDDGFSVIDYFAVNPDVGDWADVNALGDHFRLMFDAVINHISQHSNWFQAYLQDEGAI